jgi:hypothetical protein
MPGYSRTRATDSCLLLAPLTLLTLVLALLPGMTS